MEKDLFLRKLGKRIHTLRAEKGLSQAELGARIQKDQQSIQRLEKGAVNPTIYYLIEIAQGLEISLPELLTFDIQIK
jgi:putative transcriptional regulator